MTDSNQRLYFNSPIGILELVGTSNSLVSLSFVENEKESVANEYLNLCKIQLEEYFTGKRQVFEINLAIDGTEFQKRVWNELLQIPYGKTMSYLELSKSMGDIKTIRAVGRANGKNKIAIVVPCHRVISNNGSLVGYAGGLWRKKWLLDHEQKYYGGEKQLEIQF